MTQLTALDEDAQSAAKRQ